MKLCYCMKNHWRQYEADEADGWDISCLCHYNCILHSFTLHVAWTWPLCLSPIHTCAQTHACTHTLIDDTVLARWRHLCKPSARQPPPYTKKERKKEEKTPGQTLSLSLSLVKQTQNVGFLASAIIFWGGCSIPFLETRSCCSLLFATVWISWVGLVKDLWPTWISECEQECLTASVWDLREQPYFRSHVSGVTSG